jgi:rare lipoprotein A
MRNKIILSVFVLLSGMLLMAFTSGEPKQKGKNNANKTIVTLKKTDKFIKETKTDSLVHLTKNSALQILDSIKKPQEFNKLKLHKKNAHASYYHSKFNGRRTANGEIFSNDKYTAAHKKLPFGTILKVTSETTGRFVIVTVNDRGPFVKARDIDLSRKAFMDLVDNKGRGTVPVTIEIVED